MYMDMAGRHHARYLDIDIIGTTVLKPSQCLRPRTAGPKPRFGGDEDTNLKGPAAS
jgi:hypothetical protein